MGPNAVGIGSGCSCSGGADEIKKYEAFKWVRHW